MAYRIFALGVICTLCAALGPARAQLPAKSEMYEYVGANQELTEVLRSFAADQRLHIVISHEIPPRAINESVKKTPEEFLNYITGKYGLVWYFDGTSLYIDRGDRLVTRYFRLNGTTPDRVVSVLQSLNAYTTRFGFHTLTKENVILVVGPPRFVEMTEYALEVLRAGNRFDDLPLPTLEVFELKYASAVDRTIPFNGSTRTIPGVASLLRSLIYYDDDNSILQPLPTPNLSRFTPAQTQFSAMPPIPGAPPIPNPGQPQAEQLPPPAQTPAQPGQPDLNNPYPASEYAENAAQANPGFRPTIAADIRRNAIIIKDYPDQMPIYAQIIRQLDQPTALIQITVNIIDVDRDNSFEWGLPSRTEWTSGGTSKLLELQLTSTDASNFAVTLVKDQTTAFMQQIKALEQEGKATLTSRPTLVTADNLQAEIDTTETFRVPIVTDYLAGLEEVDIGTRLMVTPHLILEDGALLIQLNVQIDDGSILSQTLDGIPYTRNDSLKTETRFYENQSLLIGGLFREETSETESRLPVIGRIPYIGCLFSTTERFTKQTERLILIEPRIIAYPTPEGKHEWSTPTVPSASMMQAASMPNPHGCLSTGTPDCAAIGPVPLPTAGAQPFDTSKFARRSEDLVPPVVIPAIDPNTLSEPPQVSETTGEAKPSSRFTFKWPSILRR